jgi:hypothetical protein
MIFKHKETKEGAFDWADIFRHNGVPNQGRNALVKQLGEAITLHKETLFKYPERPRIAIAELAVFLETMAYFDDEAQKLVTSENNNAPIIIPLFNPPRTEDDTINQFMKDLTMNTSIALNSIRLHHHTKNKKFVRSGDAIVFLQKNDKEERRPWNAHMIVPIVNETTFSKFYEEHYLGPTITTFIFWLNPQKSHDKFLENIREELIEFVRTANDAHYKIIIIHSSNSLPKCTLHDEERIVNFWNDVIEKTKVQFHSIDEKLGSRLCRINKDLRDDFDRIKAYATSVRQAIEEMTSEKDNGDTTSKEGEELDEPEDAHQNIRENTKDSNSPDDRRQENVSQYPSHEKPKESNAIEVNKTPMEARDNIKEEQQE